MSPPPSKRAKVEPQISGDALEEDFVLEDGFGVGSDSELDPSEPLALDGEEDNFAAGTSDQSDADEPQAEEEAPKAKAGKRKADKGTEKVAQQPKKAKGQAGRQEEGEGVGLLKPAEVLSKLEQKQAKALPNLSSLELDEFRLKEEWILDTSHISDRSNLAGFIREAVPSMPSTLGKVPKLFGSPRVLVVSGAALRVADLCREVKAYKSKEVDVAKLFAKHFKLADHVAYLGKTKVGIAVGTPNRIGKLLDETDALGLTFLSHIVLDTSHLDSKQRSLLDMPEAREDLFRHVLGNKAVVARANEGKVKLVIY